jgi:acyl-CoA synthetase (AMP-forming)/AMP-acid ligase II
MPVLLEDFFEMIKATVIVGYGMTETSPVITNRSALRRPLLVTAPSSPPLLVDVATLHLTSGWRRRTLRGLWDGRRWTRR